MTDRDSSERQEERIVRALDNLRKDANLASSTSTEYAQIIVRTLLALNGGAPVVLIPVLIQIFHPAYQLDLVIAAAIFFLGLLFAFLAAGFGYWHFAAVHRYKGYEANHLAVFEATMRAKSDLEVSREVLDRFLTRADGRKNLENLYRRRADRRAIIFLSCGGASLVMFCLGALSIFRADLAASAL